MLDATYEIVISEGLAAASQEAIAKRARVTQSAVRHYFPTKNELLVAFFLTGIERLKDLLEDKMAEEGADPRTLLLESAAIHYDRILESDDVYFFEAAAFWGHNPELRDVRDNWYKSLEQHYANLVGKVNPDWSRADRVEASFQILTLILGGWVTMGSSRPIHKKRSRKTLKAILLRGIERIV